MIIREDEESLKRMLGVEPGEFPANLVAEYEVRLRMYHMDGHGGPLGTIPIIDMLRAMKLGPKVGLEMRREIDWSRVPTDGTVLVEAKTKTPDGELWVSGVYLGRVGVGTLAVRVDGESFVKEFRRSDVRIAREKPLEAEIRPLEEIDQDPTPMEDSPWKEAKRGDTVLIAEQGEMLKCIFDSCEGKALRAMVIGDNHMRKFRRWQLKSIVPMQVELSAAATT